MNRSSTLPAETPSPQDEEYWIDWESIHSGGKHPAEVADHAGLEAAACLVIAEPGDSLLLFPEVYHRTQDIATSRIAAIVEAV